MSVSLRKAIYGVIAAVVVLLMATHQVAPDFGDKWLPAVDAGLSVAAIGLAAYKAKRVDFKVVYSGAAALVVALATAGLFSAGFAATINDVLLQVSILIPSVLAFVRTDTSTASGMPAAEEQAQAVTDAESSYVGFKA